MLRALVVEDHEGMRRVLQRALECGGWEVTAIDDGAGLEDALARERFDLVVLDLRMPGLNGFESLRLLRQADRVPRFRRTPADVPVVVVSGEATPATFAFCRRLGANACLGKPIDVEAFQRLVEELISGL